VELHISKKILIAIIVRLIVRVAVLLVVDGDAVAVGEDVARRPALTQLR
jgi:hypothetical protein